MNLEQALRYCKNEWSQVRGTLEENIFESIDLCRKKDLSTGIFREHFFWNHTLGCQAMTTEYIILSLVQEYQILGSISALDHISFEISLN